jgi:hypothetical protein
VVLRAAFDAHGSRVVCMLVNMWCTCGVHVGAM